MRTARSRTSGENLFGFFIAPFSQELEFLQNSGRFNLSEMKPGQHGVPKQQEMMCHHQRAVSNASLVTNTGNADMKGVSNAPDGVPAASIWVNVTEPSSIHSAGDVLNLAQPVEGFNRRGGNVDTPMESPAAGMLLPSTASRIEDRLREKGLRKIGVFAKHDKLSGRVKAFAAVCAGRRCA